MLDIMHHQWFWSVVLIFILVLIGMLNIIEQCFIYYYKKKISGSEKCIFLRAYRNNVECTHNRHKKRFMKNGNSCRNCCGKSVEISNETVKSYIKARGLLFQIIIIGADFGSAVLPYISIVFTLLVAAFVTSLPEI